MRIPRFYLYGTRTTKLMYKSTKLMVQKKLNFFDNRSTDASAESSVLTRSSHVGV
jgi:hypothetical protein